MQNDCNVPLFARPNKGPWPKSCLITAISSMLIIGLGMLCAFLVLVTNVSEIMSYHCRHTFYPIWSQKLDQTHSESEQVAFSNAFINLSDKINLYQTAGLESEMKILQYMLEATHNGSISRLESSNFVDRVNQFNISEMP